MSKALCLRTCNKDRKAYGGFQWPESGKVEAPDWSPEPKCGHGLHGLLWGTGDISHLSESPDAVWMVVEADESTIVDLSGKVKFPACEVVYLGIRDEAVRYILANGGAGKPVHWATATAGYRGTATAGCGGTATAGDGGTATAGDRGTATAGDGGTATAGCGGTATAGDGGTATAGDGGTATAGDRGVITVLWWDSAARKHRRAVGVIGENGLLPGVPYRWESGKWVEAKKEQS